MSSVVIFGAGSVGRGFIGQIFSEAGWHVTFVDVDDEVIASLQQGSYRHATLSDEATEERLITGVDAIHGRDVDAVADAVAGADFLATAVGAANLAHIAPSLAEGLRRRRRGEGGPVDVLLAENLHGAADKLRSLLAEHLEDSDATLANVGLLETSIGRMIPVPNLAMRAEDPGWIAVEPYRELPLDVSAAKAQLPDVPELLGRTDVPFAFFTDRKLYIHNLGHCVTAYLGELAGDEEIADAIRRPEVFGVVRAVMGSVAEALSLEYDEPKEVLDEHVDDLLHRFANRALHDTVERVGRDPRRKLANEDRFLGAFALTARHGLQRPVTHAVALGTHKLLATLDGPEQATELERIRGFIAGHGGEQEAKVFDESLEAISRSPEVATVAAAVR